MSPRFSPGLVFLATIVGCGAKNARAVPFTLGNSHFRVQISIENAALRRKFGPRFDNTANVSQVWLDGHSFLGGPGLADEFGLMGVGVLGFAEARAGETFLKIGVGQLVRSKDLNYGFWNSYPVARLLAVKVQASPQRLTVQQDAPVTQGYAYRYRKSYLVGVRTGTLEIRYTLRNTGQKAFEFEQYNHNWFTFDGQKANPSWFVAPRFALGNAKAASWLDRRVETPGLARLGIKSGSITPGNYDPPLALSHAENALVVGDERSGQRVGVRGNFPISHFALFANPDALCPEVFVRRRLLPGKTTTWKRSYRFTNSKRNAIKFSLN